MATVKQGDTVLTPTGLPGRITELQGDGHAQVYLAGSNGTMQFALADLRLIETGDATDELINSHELVESKSGNTISPVPADLPTVGEVFPGIVEATTLTPAPGADLNTAHPWPGQVQSGVLGENVAGDLNPYRNEEVERRNALARAETRAARAEEDELLKQYPDTDGDGLPDRPTEEEDRSSVTVSFDPAQVRGDGSKNGPKSADAATADEAPAPARKRPAKPADGAQS